MRHNVREPTTRPILAICAATIFVPALGQAVDDTHPPLQADLRGGDFHSGASYAAALEHIDGLYLSNPTRADLRRLLQAQAPTQAQADCNDWADLDSRAALFAPVAASGLLLVGEADGPLVNVGAIDIRNLVRLYAVANFTKSGRPLNGAMTVKIPHNQLDELQSCLHLLPGTPVAWPSSPYDPTDIGYPVKMLVDSVEFSRDATVDSAGQVTPTGDWIAKLKLSESWISMANREIMEHAWGIVGGIAGSIFLMGTTALLRRTVPRLRTALGTAWQNTQSSPGKRHAFAPTDVSTWISPVPNLNYCGLTASVR